MDIYTYTHNICILGEKEGHLKSLEKWLSGTASYVSPIRRKLRRDRDPVYETDRMPA